MSVKNQRLKQKKAKSTSVSQKPTHEVTNFRGGIDSDIGG